MEVKPFYFAYLDHLTYSWAGPAALYSYVDTPWIYIHNFHIVTYSVSSYHYSRTTAFSNWLPHFLNPHSLVDALNDHYSMLEVAYLRS